MTYDKALDIIMPLYAWEFNSGTYSEYEIEGILISAIVRRGCSTSSARRYVLQFLDS